MRAGIKSQHLATPALIPQSLDRVRRPGHLATVEDQAHLGVRERHAEQLRALCQARNRVPLQKPGQLGGRLGNPGQRQRRQLIQAAQSLQFNRVGRHHVKRWPAGVRIAPGQSLAQHFVGAHDGELDTNLETTFECFDDVSIGIAGPGQHPQDATGVSNPTPIRAQGASARAGPDDSLRQSRPPEGAPSSRGSHAACHIRCSVQLTV